MNPITCGMAADLLPLYLDGCCSADSGAAIEAHMDTCPACRAQYAQLRRDLTPAAPAADDPGTDTIARALARKMRRRKRCLRALGAVLGVLLAVFLVFLGKTFVIHFDSFRGDSKLETWLCAIAKNAYHKHRRHSARTVGADALETQPAETDFVERFLDREQAQQIYRHVHELGAQYKEVFLLRTLGELSFRDIADIFGKSESWAKVTYFRAKNKIIERMEGST